MLSESQEAHKVAPGAATSAVVDVDLLLQQARAAEDDGNPEAAVLAFTRALAIDRRHLGALCGLGELLSRIKCFEEALVCFDKALALDPRHAPAIFHRGLALGHLGEDAAAVECFKRVLSLQPGHLGAIGCLAMGLRGLGRYEEALSYLDRALQSEPENPEALACRGAALADLGRFDEALQCFERSLAIRPNHADTLMSRSLAYLASGRLLEGFRAYESRWQTDRFRRPLSQLWLGEAPLAGKTILLPAEQGIGDTLQFVRFAPLVADRAARAILCVPSPLRRLLESVDPRIEVRDAADVPGHDCYCPIVSLAAAFRCTLDTIPVRVPYLAATPEAAAAWHARLGTRRKPRIGLVWSGQQYPRTPLRDVPLPMLASLLDLDAEFISLQKEVSASDRKLLERLPLARHGETLTDFADTAALIANLDLVISVDTAAAHLAGALGKPVWILNRFASCWRWMRDRDDSPWYPTARLFRQKTPGDWAEVVERIKREAALLVTRRLAAGARQAVDPTGDEAGILQRQAYASIAAGDYTNAGRSLDRLLQFRPDDVQLLSDRGSVAGLLGQSEQSLEYFARALARDPTRVDTLFNYGLALGMADRHPDAVVALEQAIAVRADHADALSALAFSLRSLGRLDEALACLDKALAIDPVHAGALANRGLTLTYLYRGQEALACFERLGRLGAESRHLDAFAIGGGGLFELARYVEAEALLDKVLRVQPAHAGALLNRGAIRLMNGDLPGGFRDSEARWRTAKLSAVRFATTAPRWSGVEPVESKTVLLFHDQGFGDSLQFIRYAPLLCRRGARVILRVPETLRALMQSLPAQPPGAMQMIGESQAPLPAHDFHCPIMSLPLAFGTDLATIPAAIPYLTAAAESAGRWRERLGSKTRMRIGILWRGRPYPPLNHARDVPLGDLAPLFGLPADYISLQKEVTKDEAALLDGLPLARHGESLADFADTAALVENLDLVITADSAVAHLAGAMGKPVWIMNRYASCWRWLRDREDSPWYPTVRLFRQKSLGDWAGVVEQVRQALQGYLRQAQPQPQGKPPALARTSAATAALAQAIADENAGNHAAAIGGFAGVLQLDPRSVAALCGLGRVMLRIESYDEALVCLGKALAIDPQHAESHFCSGIALHLLGRGPEAIDSFDRALGLDPDHLDAMFRRAAALADMARFDEALSGFDRLFALRPDDVAVLDGRAFVLASLGRLDGALAAYDRVLAIDPEHAGARRRRSWIYLAQGKLLEGFRDHEYRWKELQGYAKPHQRSNLVTPPLGTSAPLWLGDAPLSGKTLLLHHEQGLGDTLHFVRYAPMAAALGARVILGVPPSLRRLLGRMPAVADVTVRRDALPSHDFHCPMPSLPLAFRTELDSIPANIPYLQADPRDRAAWAQRLGRARRPRIGLAWSGGAFPPGRAVPLNMLAPLLRLDAEFISLQKDLLAGDDQRLSALPIARHGEALEDFADAAALIENLDLVVTVDTAVAHLAGALGRPVWVLLKFPADWRWLLDRDDSPWYPSARLFRQRVFGEWGPVIDQVQESLKSLLAAHRPDPAAPRGDTAAAAHPRRSSPSIASLVQLAEAAERSEDYQTALRRFAEVLRIDPRNADALCALGRVMLRIESFEEAHICLDKALALDPRHAAAHFHRGMAFWQLGDERAAIDCFERVIALLPNHANALFNLGTALLRLARYDDALDSFDRLLAIQPDHVAALDGRGMALAGRGDLSEAQAAFDRLLRLEPEHSGARYRRSWIDLARGNLKEGFRGFEHRWKSLQAQKFRRHELHLRHAALETPAPLWLGDAPLAGKTLLLHHEQGLGDTLQFVRYAPLAAALGARVILGVPPSLCRLLEAMPGISRVITATDSLPPHDYHCPIMSLPLAFGTELATVPASIPYLVADAELHADWAQRLGTRTRPRIGLVWDGGRNPPGRDVPLDMLRVLLELDAEFISLQKDLGEGDAGYLEEFGIAHQGELLEDFADTAALIENLDLVITVDTATAHLAGALGKPVWVLLKYAADWRWLLERTDSPWYPSARLFRQASAGDWFGVVRNLRHAAASFLREQQVGSRPVAFEADIRRGIALLNVGGDIDRAARLHRSGRSDAALRLIDQVLAVRPDLPEALLVRAVALAKGGRHADALATTERLLAVSPDATEALCIRGHALRALARPREALECFDRALAIEPDRVNALALRSFVYAELGRVDAALASMDRALALAPSDADTLELKASLLQRLGRRREALECQERVIAAEPRRANALKNRGLLKLSLGQLAEGFRDLEQRWNTAEFEPDQLRTHAPPWTGSEGIAGKTILLHHEQGFGDSLQFARYVPLVAARGARVMLRVPGALARLMQTLGPGVCVIIQPDPGVAQSEPLPPHDFHCSLLSLPAAFGTTLASIPAQIPYLHAHPERAAYWRAKLGPKVRPRVGLAWAGRQVPPIVERRDVPLEALQPLLALDAEFISLQRELAQADRQALQSLPVRLLGEWLEDFADAAALIQHLDLVISVDTAVLHLAGALGKPVWLMNRFAPCWRWLEDRSDSPWYPTLRLFGQKVSGDWAGVVDEVKHAAAPFLKTCCASDVGASAAPQAKFSALMGEGLFRFEQGEVAAALDCFSRALHQVPGDGGALINRASALARLGRFEEALECFAQVPPDHPGYPIVLLNRANALRQLARYAEALEQLERLLPMRPDDVQVLHDLGFTLARMWRFGEALAFLDRALAANPTYTAAYVTRAFVLDALERDEEAAADLKRALVLEPGRLDALNNYGDALLKLSRAEEALEVFRRAVQLAPEDFGARHNCWTAVDKLGRHAEALQMCEQFLAEHPANAEARLDRAICLLSDGRLREGFADFEARWETSPCREARLATGAPRWLGDAPLGGKTLLLYREQGLGDAIQFVRFVPLVAARGARVVLRVPAVLKTFMESMHCLSATGTAQLVVEGEPLPPHDYQCPLMSLPLAFDTDLNTVPAQVPYLHADPRRVEQWAMRLSGTSRLRVGLAWSGRLTPPVIPRRDIPLRMLAPLLELDADFISLQKEMRPADREFLATLPMLRHGETLEDFADTAALIENLDLVICVDTSVAHVAGAIGKPVWIMNRSDGCWRWLRERGDSPWYPTARLFRQPTLGDWAPAVEEVRRWLRDAIESKRQRKATNEASDDGSARSLKRPLLIA